MSKARDEFVAPGRARLAGLQRGEQSDEHTTTLRIITRLVNASLDAVGAATDDRLTVPPRPVSGAPPDGGWSTELLERFVRRVERASRRMGVAPLPGVAIGSLPSADLSPLSSHVHGSSAMIAVPIGTMLFANLLAKAVVPLVCRVVDNENGKLHVALGEPARRHTKDALRRFRELMAAVGLHGNPGKAPRYIPSPGWRWWSTASAFRDAMEFFCVAHEYAHLLQAHGRFRLEAPAEVPAEEIATQMPLAEELACDAFAMRAAVEDRGEPLPLRIAGPVAMMKVFALLQRDGHLSVGDRHPRASDRLAIMKAQLESLQERGVLPRTLAKIHRDIERVETLIDRAWLDVRDDLQSVEFQEFDEMTFQELTARLGAVVTDIVGWHLPRPDDRQSDE